MIRISIWHKANAALLGLGILLILYPVALISYYAYPIFAWGLLGVLDWKNLRRWNSSLMGWNPKWFWGIIVPSSVLFWLFFEFLNLLWPQWRYINAPPNHTAAAILSFLSYSTVIPLVMEVFWLIYGPHESLGLSPGLERFLAPRRWLSPSFGILLLAIFLFDRSFNTVQVMWCIPFFVFLPFVPTRRNTSPKYRSALPAVIAAAFVSGLIWETGNYWAQTKWDYLLLRRAPHLFEMPLAGYLGYIPFAFSLLVVYLWLRARIGYTPARAVALYALALLASYLFIVRYFAIFPP